MSSQGSHRPGSFSITWMWQDALTPRGRGIVAFVVIGLFVALLLSPGLVPTAGAAMLGIWVGAIATLFLARIGYFAASVPVVLVGGSGPQPVRLRVRPGSKRGRVETLDAPDLVPAADADREPRPSERVLGVVRDGAARAYPLRILSVREAVNDTLGGRPIAVTWSPFCYAGRVFDAVAAGGSGEPVRFVSSGQSMLNSPLLADRASGSLYVQYLGRPLGLSGEDERLPEIPAVNTTWEAWSAAYPETLLLQDPVAPDHDVFETYYMSSRAGLYRAPRRDHRWPAKEVVAGVEINGDPRGFPLLWLREQPVVCEEVGGERVLIVFEQMSATVLGFRPVVDGRSLEFIAAVAEPTQGDAPADVSGPGLDGGGEDDATGRAYEPLILQDQETGSRWHALRGECLDGELAGATMDRVPAALSFWFAWSNFHPGARLMARPAVNLPGPSESHEADANRT